MNIDCGWASGGIVAEGRVSTEKLTESPLELSLEGGVFVEDNDAAPAFVPHIEPLNHGLLSDGRKAIGRWIAADSQGPGIPAMLHVEPRSWLAKRWSFFDRGHAVAVESLMG